MLSLKQAVDIAVRYCQELFPAFSDFQLEEIEKTSEQNWLITIGFYKPLAQSHIFSNSPMLDMPRKYKVLEINAETGEIKSLKIREV